MLRRRRFMAMSTMPSLLTTRADAACAPGTRDYHSNFGLLTARLILRDRHAPSTITRRSRCGAAAFEDGQRVHARFGRHDVGT